MGRVKLEQERALTGLDAKDGEKKKKDTLFSEIGQNKQKIALLLK